jgi:hypothetical protein
VVEASVGREPRTAVVELPTLTVKELSEEPLPMYTVLMPEGKPAGMVARVAGVTVG